MDGHDASEPITRLLLVDDHVSVREALASVFDRQIDFEVVGQASTCADAVGQLAGVDLAVIDLRLPDGNGSTLIPLLRRLRPPAQAIVLTGAEDRASLAEAVDRGAAAVLNKNVPLDDVVDAVRRLRAGQTLIPKTEIFALLRQASEDRARGHIERAAMNSLTAREREVLAALASGLNSRQVAERLGISPRTERNHVSNVLSKLGVRSQLQAVLLALRHQVVSLDGTVSGHPPV